MKRYQGTGISRGIAVGRAVYMDSAETFAEDARADDPEKELARYRAAKERVIALLEEDQACAIKTVGEESAQIFAVHRMMLEEPDFVGCIERAVREEGRSAPTAVREASDKLCAMFAAMEDEYLRARADDVRDISNRLLEAMGVRKTAGGANEPFIAFAQDLTPSQTMRLDHSLLQGFATKQGNACSHAAILARSLHIPMVSNLSFSFDDLDGRLCALNGASGEVVINPTTEAICRFQEVAERETECRLALNSLKSQACVTADGRRISLFANIGTLDELQMAKENGAEGIGLLRSEFLFMKSENPPTEEEQFEFYARVLREMEGKRVVIRTLDIGADKPAPCLPMAAEPNPALGNRGIRFCLTHRAVFKTQMRALLRASVHGALGIMFPMIVNEKELDDALEALQETQAELLSEGIVIDEGIRIGIMIETPAAALISEELAPKVDFFSIGTNDLTQYTTACDRTNSAVAHLYDWRHPAVLRLIELTVSAAHRHAKQVGICGESAADPQLSEFFVGIGVAELSVGVGSILEIKNRIRSIGVNK